MIKHYLTKYIEGDNRLVIVAWLQINIFNRSYCFSEKKIVIRWKLESPVEKVN